MILTKGILQKHTGAMRRLKGNAFPVIPMISPGIQGQAAYDMLSKEQKGQLKTALQDAAKQLKCSVQDLQWCVGRFGEIKVRKRKRIAL